MLYFPKTFFCRALYGIIKVTDGNLKKNGNDGFFEDSENQFRKFVHKL